MTFRKEHQRVAVGVMMVLACASSLAAQAARPQYKGIWEPVSYSEDLSLSDVFFVNVDVGWVAGAAGTILHTKDGGTSWTAQLGGDPGDAAAPISRLRFFDEHHGWATQDRKLLRTQDGESWEEIGTLPHGFTDMAFTSPTVGFAGGKPAEVGGSHNTIFRTQDGGKSWKPVWTCVAKAMINGLARNISCTIEQFHFVTPDVGYVVLATNCVGMGCGPPPLIAKTEDGGESWEAFVGPGVIDQDKVGSLFFTDEKTGYVRLESGKLHVTKDGGATWRGVVASPGNWLRFADPDVGWAYNIDGYGTTLSYTTDGGARWSTRPLRFPTYVLAASFPRRDRAYVVGSHGMVYRYRVVPAAHAMKANDVAAPAMPGFDSELDEQAEQLETIVEELSTMLGAPADAGAEKAAGTATEADATEPLDAPMPAASEFMTKCCGKSFSRLELVLGAMSQTLPELLGKYRNLNLLFAGLRMSAELPAQYRGVKGGLKAFRKADNKEGAQKALNQVAEALRSFKQTTAVAMQKELPPNQQ